MKPNEPASAVQHHRFAKNPLVVLLGTVLLFLVIQLLAAVVWLPLLQAVENKNFQLLVISSGNIFFLGAALFILKNSFNISWSSFGFKWARTKAFLEIIPALLFYFLVSITVTTFAIKFIPGFDADQAQDIGFEALKQPLELAAAFLTLVVFVPVFEEVIFRGILFKGLRHRIPFWLSAVITSLIFAAAHGQLNVAIDTFALSMLLCFLVERHKSVAPAILLHALKNGVAFSLLFIFK